MVIFNSSGGLLFYSNIFLRKNNVRNRKGDFFIPVNFKIVFDMWSPYHQNQLTCHMFKIITYNMSNKAGKVVKRDHEC